MPVTKSALKKMRQDNKRRQVNRLKKEKLKELLKTTQKTPIPKNIQAAISFVDKAAKINLVHKNKAARLKSHLSQLKVKAKPPAKPRKGKT